MAEAGSREISGEAVTAMGVEYQETDLRNTQNGVDWLGVVNCEGEGKAKNPMPRFLVWESDQMALPLMEIRELKL